NTAPVAWGAIGTPIVTLAAVSGLDELQLSTMAGHQLPWVSILVPFWLVVTFVKMEGGSWRQAFEVWPGALVSGGTFAAMQYFASGTNQLHLMTDVVAGVFRSEEHTSELQSLRHLVCRLLLEKKKHHRAKLPLSIN